MEAVANRERDSKKLLVCSLTALANFGSFPLVDDHHQSTYFTKLGRKTKKPLVMMCTDKRRWMGPAWEEEAGPVLLCRSVSIDSSHDCRPRQDFPFTQSLERTMRKKKEKKITTHPPTPTNKKSTQHKVPTKCPEKEEDDSSPHTHKSSATIRCNSVAKLRPWMKLSSSELS